MFDLANIWATRTGNQVRVTSANDHVHARQSAHYAGLALDLLSTNPDALAQLFRQVGYRVLWRVPGHYGHIHVQDQGPLAVPVEAADRRSASRGRPAATASTSPSTRDVLLASDSTQ